MFTLTIQVSTIEEAERILAALKHTADPAAVAQVQDQLPPPAPEGATVVTPESENTQKNSEAIEQTPRRRGRPPKAAQESPASGATESNGPPTVTEQPEPTATQATFSIDDARGALKDVQAKYGTADMAKPLAILEQFGAARISEVKAADYPAFIAACKAA